MTIILTIYRHYEIELQPLPPIAKYSKIDSKISYSDLPTLNLIKQALHIANPKMKGVILLICSSGMGRTEITNLTCQSFINATKEYHNSTNINDVVNELKDQENIVPTWKLHRQKTNKDYYTFSTPESTTAIIEYLSTSNRLLENTDKLFNIGNQGLTMAFRRLNAKLGAGKRGAYIRFRPHMLRKYHATQLHKGENSLSLDEIDSLQGRSKNTVHESYFMEDPQDLKKKYIRAIDKVTINQDVSHVTFESQEYLQLKRDYDLLKNKVEDLVDNRVDSILSKYQL